jgi:hypothetical protein
MDMAGREIVFRDLRQQHWAESGARTRWLLVIAAPARRLRARANNANNNSDKWSAVTGGQKGRRDRRKFKAAFGRHAVFRRRRGAANVIGRLEIYLSGP